MQLAEHEGGISRLWERDDLPPAVAAYVDCVRPLNPKGTLTAYPGSPWIAWQRLRPEEKLRLFELHGISSVLVNLHHFHEQVAAFLASFPTSVRIETV